MGWFLRLTLGVALVWLAAAPQAQARDRLRLKEGLIALVEVSNRIRDHHFDRNFIEEEWPERVEKARRSIVAQGEDPYEVIEGLVNGIGTSHLAFYPPGHGRDDWPSPAMGGGRSKRDFSLYKVGGNLMVGALEEGSPSWQQGLRNAMVVKSIAEWEAGERFDRDDLISRLHHILESWGEEPLLLRVKGKGSLVLNFEEDETPMSEFGHLKAPRRVEVKRIKGDLLYLSFNCFLFDQVREIKAGIRENLNAKGVIIDLRGNGGGIGMLATAIAMEFCDQDYSLGEMSGLDMHMKFPVLAQPEPCLAPVVILVDGNSFSTSEILARGMQVEGRATVMGQATAGLALPSVIVTLEDGSLLQYPVASFVDASGRVLEGRGVQPDVLVPIDAEALKSGFDHVLEAARLHLSRTQPAHEHVE